MASSDYMTLMLQKHYIEKTYDCFRCTVSGRRQTMICKGTLKPLDYIETYEIEIKVKCGVSPRVYVKKPKITYSEEIHMYKDGHLCLYYPWDMVWGSTTSIADYTIPWTNEWILYYELYKISGVWEGPAAPHQILE